MTCSDCTAARLTSGLWKTFDPLCLYCGARLIQSIRKLQIPKSQASARCTAVLADWVRAGHVEKDIRALVTAHAAALEPVTETKARRK